MGLKSIINALGKETKEIPVVIGINQIDNLGEWDHKLNLPTKQTENDIERKAKDIIAKLSSRECTFDRSHIEYYSAMRAYRLNYLLYKIIKSAKKDSNFGMRDFDPKSVWDKSVSPEMPQEVRDYYAASWAKRMDQAGKFGKFSLLLEDLKKNLSKADREQLDAAFTKKMETPPKIGILGKAGVGKTTTVNNLFNATFKTSRTFVGTTEAQYKDFELPDGGIITIVDMPGYGRSIREDKIYEEIYLQVLPQCDVILLIVQANSRDFVDDQEMLIKISKWGKNGMLTENKGDVNGMVD